MSTPYKGDPNGVDKFKGLQITATHDLMLKAVQAKLGHPSAAELFRECIERLYAEHCPDGELRPPPRRFRHSDARVYRAK